MKTLSNSATRHEASILVRVHCHDLPDGKQGQRTLAGLIRMLFYSPWAKFYRNFRCQFEASPLGDNCRRLCAHSAILMLEYLAADAVNTSSWWSAKLKKCCRTLGYIRFRDGSFVYTASISRGKRTLIRFICLFFLLLSFSSFQTPLPVTLKNWNQALESPGRFFIFQMFLGETLAHVWHFKKWLSNWHTPHSRTSNCKFYGYPQFNHSPIRFLLYFLGNLLIRVAPAAQPSVNKIREVEISWRQYARKKKTSSENERKPRKRKKTSRDST